MTVFERGKKAVHRQVKFRVIALDGCNEFFGVNRHGQFFFDFSDNRLSSGFPRLNLAARKFPTVLKVAISALGGKDFSVLMNDGSYDFNGFLDG